METHKMLSIILLSYFSENRIFTVYEQVKQKMEAEQIPFELIIIDDGSKDESFKKALELEETDSRVRAFQLSRNYTSHYARFAGLSKSKGACAVGIPDDLQTPLEVIVKMYRHWENGNKIVIPFRASRNDGWLSDLFSTFYYGIMNAISDVNFPKGGADGFLIDREVVDIMNERIHPINTSTIVEVLRLGFDPVFIPFNRPTVKSKSRWTFKKKLKLASDTIFSSSSFPIKCITIIGFISVIISVFSIIVSTFLKFSGNQHLFGLSIPGWTSTFVLISFFCGLILFSLGVIAEYIWRIYEEVKNRPGYIIKDKTKPKS
ncbi:glycosyltransferase [uncultured Draconibacterium sp.]|mgnify:CR=1 FL=1|uniref:glycosyltransferase n=1 Tax=uncultured Draconibacterium sp. TaxID=1573823 RepID=UPI0025F3F007|nr:glycosyltransferase [uncultured Draconibacterium sp.]